MSVFTTNILNLEINVLVTHQHHRRPLYLATANDSHGTNAES